MPAPSLRFLPKTILILLFFIATHSLLAQCIQGDAAVCAGSTEEYTIVDLPPGTASTQWSALGGNVILPNTNTSTDVTWGNSSTGRVVATFLNTGGQEVGKCTLNVSIGFLPQVFLTPAVSHSCVIGSSGEKEAIAYGYCVGELVEFIGGGGISYTWSASGGAVVESINSSAGTAMIRFISTGPAQVCVTATGANGCQRTTCSSYVVYPSPTAGISVLSHPGNSGPINVCLNESLTFEGMFSDPTPFALGGYTWRVTASNNPGIILGGGAGQFFSFTFTQPGGYDVTVTATNCLGCSDEAVMHVVVNPNAAPQITCPSVVCQDGDAVPYCAPIDCVNLSWDVVGGSWSAGNSPNCINVIWNDPPSNGFGLVTLTCPDALCPLPTTVEVPIIPTDLHIDGPKLICDKEQDNNIYSVPNWPGCTYDWILAPSVGTLVGTPNGSSFEVDLNGFSEPSYTITLTVRNVIANCTVTTSLSVDVMNYNITTSPQGNFCYNFPNGSGPTFTVTPAPASNYQIIWNISKATHFWTTTTAPNVNTLSGLTFNDAFGGMAGSFNVQAIILNANGESTCPGLITTVTINLPVPPITEVKGPINICPGGEYNYQVVPAANQYEWTVLGGTIIQPADPLISPNIRVLWHTNPTAPYSLSVRRKKGLCYSDPVALNITATPLVNFSISSPDFAGCFDVPYTYVASDLQMDSYNWSVEGGVILSGQGTHTVQVIWSMNAPSHQITLQSKFCDVDYTATLNPSFHSLEFSLEGPDKACQNIAVEYVVVPANATSYTWYIDGNVIPGQTGPVLDILFPFVGTVTIRVRIEGPNGCLGFANLEKIVTVLPNPMPSITQQGVLYCDEKGMTTLITQVPSGGGSSFEWQHFENGGFVPVDQSAFSAFYTPNGANLDIQYIPGGGMLGLFRVLVSGGECISEATRNVSCVPAISDPGGPIPVIFTAWQYDAACGQVWASGELSCEALINSWFQVLDPSLPNPFYADPQEICNPNVLIGTFTHPGVYQVALIGEFDFDGHGPNPPVRYADIREITIPYVLGFTSRITCVNNQSGSYMVDLLNLTQQIPQYPNVEWTWTIDGNVHSHDLNPPPYEIQAGQSIHVCLRAHVQVPDDEDPELRKDYDCEICEQISAPTDLTVSIEGVQSNTCDGILLQPTAGVSDPSLVLSYTWVLENSTHNVHYESNIAEPVFAPPSQDTYTLSVTVMFSNGCTATATQDVVVAPGNIVHIYILNTPATCGERILTAETDPPNLPVTYLWSSGQTTSEITVTVTGTYTVTVTETATGCTKTNSASLVINGPFIGGYSGQFIQCEGESDLKVSVIVRPGYTYTLTLSNGQSSTYTATGILPWEIPLNPSSLPAGTYSFVITAEETATNLPCTTQLTGILQVNPAAEDISVSLTYSCGPFSALLVADHSVAWYRNGVFVSHGTQIQVYTGGNYEAVVTNAYGCTRSKQITVADPPNVNILTGCYCIDSALIQSGEAVVYAPSGTYTSWAWVLNGTTILASCSPPSSCSTITPLVLQAAWQGDITLQVTQTYTNSDGSTVICGAKSGVFCWWLGPCDYVACEVPKATTRTIACLEDYGTYQQYHIHWDFMDNGTTHPCNYPQNLPITGAYSGNFVMITHSLINGYWHFEGIFNLNTNGAVPIPEPFDICWEIPFCLNTTGQQCGVAQVCPRKDNPQHNDDVIIGCYDHDLPYCDNISTSATIICDDEPGNGVTHVVNLDLSVTIPATANTTNCPNFSFYITSVTGTMPIGLERIDVPNVPVVNGQQTITATVPILWYDEIGMDYICFQVILAHSDHCWPTDGNICSKRFCFDASGIDCQLEISGYRFTAQCSREQGDGGVLYEYSVVFPSETEITQCSVKNSNPEGFNKIVNFAGNQVTGTYLSYKGSLAFDDLFVINNTNGYRVKASLPRCDGNGGDRSGHEGGMQQHAIADASEDASLRLIPNPTSGAVTFVYSLPVEDVASEYSIVVVNPLGMLQQRFDLSRQGGDGTIRYEADALPNGVYQVCIFRGKQMLSSQRMVVMRDK